MESRLADALASTAAAVLLVGTDARVEYANAAAATLLALEAPKLCARHVDELLRLDAEPGVRTALLGAIDEGEEWAGEMQVTRPGGQRVPCILTASPVRRASGSRDGFVLTLRDVSERVAMEEALRAANRRLARQASHDHLTGLYNRGFVREVLDREVARSHRYGTELSLLMVDLDRFKRVNDDSGHELGDFVLQDVSQVLPRALRDGDVVGRWGGDEFCVLLPHTSAIAGRGVADRICEHVREALCGPDDDVRLSASLGLMTTPDPTTGEHLAAAELLRRADTALLRAKRAGGDRVVVWREAAVS
jgi:diguanylate cyclase (GGDEF)-like protein/PAS domain S-box-containing protein